MVLVAGAAPAGAETIGEWKDICVIAMQVTNAGRTELEPFVGASLGNGEPFGYASAGATLRHQLSDNLLVAIGGRRLVVAHRADLPGTTATGARTGGGAFELGYAPLFGKLALGDRVIALDVIATAGVGVVARDDPGGSRVWIAFPVGALVRINVHSWFSIDLGLHDDIVPWDPVPRSVARTTTMPPSIFAPSVHELEARVGIGLWLPVEPRRRCRIKCG
jgi:hypothetical protein